MNWARTILRLFQSVAVLACLSWAAFGAEFEAAGYTFSDELGGFKILSVTGSGARDDPIIIEQEILQIDPITMIVRRVEQFVPGAPRRVGGWLAMHVRIVALNNSGLSWQGFEVELQEERKKSSTYSDGLSFDQGTNSDRHVASDKFAHNERLYEPYDRIRFERGSVTVQETVTLGFPITDVTPVNTFYIREDPRILLAHHRSMDPLQSQSARTKMVDQFTTETAVAGSVMMNLLPTFGCELAIISQPCCRQKALQVARPMPIPSYSLPACKRLNG